MRCQHSVKDGAADGYLGLLCFEGSRPQPAPMVLARVKERALQGNRNALTRAAKEYGMVRTRKFFNGLVADAHAS